MRIQTHRQLPQGDSLTLRALVEQDTTLRQAGKELVGLCSLHAEQTPSFFLNEEKGVWYCYGCNQGGDIVSYYVKVRGLTMREALQRTGRAAPVIDLRQTDRARQAREAVLHTYFSWVHDARKRLTTLHAEIEITEIAYRSICRAPHLWPEEEQTYWITRLGDLYQHYEILTYETDVMVTDPAGAWEWWRKEKERR